MAIVTAHAGHGGKKNGSSWTDPGAVGNGYLEATVARTITDKMIAKTGAKNITDNTSTNSNAIINTQAARINQNADGYHISNHLNAATPAATGVEVLYGNVAQKALAAKMSAAIAKVLGIPDRGAKDGSWLGIARLTGSGKKVLLIEWGFISNSGDMKKLMANMNNAIDAVLKELGYNTTSKPTPSNPSKPAATAEFKKGDTVKVLSKATHYQTGQAIASFVKGQKYKIKDVKNVNQSASKKAYLLDGINSWLLHQDLELVSAASTNTAKKVGDTVEVLSKATHYQTGQAIASFVKGKKYKIKQIKSVNQSASKKAYLLDGINSWVLEQDVK